MSETQKIILNVGSQRDGYVFRPRPKSRVWLEENYPEKPRVSSVFIGFDKAVDFPQIPDAIWRQVWTLLTGLSETELFDVATNQTDGLVVFDPITRQEVYHSEPVHV